MGTKTNAALSSFAVVSAAVVGGAIRLLFYPQFILGVVLMGSSILIKLSRNIMGLVILAVILVVVSVLLFLFNGVIVKELKKVAPSIARKAKKAGTRTKEMIGQGVAAIPPYTYTLLAFTIPALGQFFGSLSTVRMLSSIDPKGDSLPGTGFMAMFSIIYLGTLTVGVSKSWLKPSKVSFLLQSIWVIRALFSPAARDMEFSKNLPSVLAGWGGFFLGLTPGGALVSACKAAAASAAVAGAGVATVHGVKAGVDAYSARNNQDGSDAEPSLDDDDINADEVVPQHAISRKEEISQVMDEWREWMDVNSMKSWFKDTFSEQSLRNWVDSAKGAAENLKPSKRSKKRSSSKRRSSRRPTVEEEDDEMVAEAAEANNEPEPAEPTEEDVIETDEMKQDMADSGLDIETMSPPMGLAATVTLFRALPTCLSLLIGISTSIISLARGQFKPGMLAIPILLAPFAMGEIALLIRHIGVRNILRGRFNEVQAKYQDGMSLLLWQSPQMLRAWHQINDWNGKMNSETFMEDLKQAPSQYLNPDDETIKATPKFSMFILGQLGLSVIIDIIGGSSYAIPALGELTDLAWAPIQGYVVHHMYGLPLLSWMGVVEEILPFTDWIPTATVGWFYCYFQYLPAWIVTLFRSVNTKVNKKKAKKDE